MCTIQAISLKITVSGAMASIICRIESGSKWMSCKKLIKSSLLFLRSISRQHIHKFLEFLSCNKFTCKSLNRVFIEISGFSKSFSEITLSNEIFTSLSDCCPKDLSPEVCK